MPRRTKIDKSQQRKRPTPKVRRYRLKKKVDLLAQAYMDRDGISEAEANNIAAAVRGVLSSD